MKLIPTFFSNATSKQEFHAALKSHELYGWAASSLISLPLQNQSVTKNLNISIVSTNSLDPTPMTQTIISLDDCVGIMTGL